MVDPRTLLRSLVETPSVSGGEGAAAAILVDAFETAGREVWVDEVGNVRAPGDESVLLTSHIDTVPGDIPARVEDGVLWGRGSVDATGPLAAMATAALETGVSFAGVVEEETTSRGARHLVETRSPPDAVVNGEPSGWSGIVLGYRGFHAGTYRVEQPSGHTALDAPNAVERGMHWWNRVRERIGASTADSVRDDTPSGEPAAGSATGNGGSGGADPPVFERMTAKPVAFDGGLTDDGLATVATVDVQFRLPPGTAADDVESAVASVTEAGTVEWGEPIPPVMRSPRNKVARAFRAAIRAEGGDPTHLRKTGTSDMNLYADAWDVPMATYGPGDSALDHAPDERLDLDEFDRSVEVLVHVADALAE